MRWHNFGSKPTKSLKELQSEVDKLKEAEKNVQSYNELQNEKAKIIKEIKQEGFKARHKKALAIISKGEQIGSNIYRKYKSPARKLLKKYILP